MKPVSLDGIFGWYSAGRSTRGVILCGTLGREQNSAHRWWRDLSAGIAATGCTVLRFDYPGEGDSEARFFELDAALGAIRRAIRFLREEAQAEEILLVGLRFGGTLAALIAEEGGVDRLVLIAPFARGQAYLREMALQARLIDIVPDGRPIPKQAGALSVGGFILSSELIRDLTNVNLCRGDCRSAKHILLLGCDRDGLATLYTSQESYVEVSEVPRLASLVSDVRQIRMPEPTRTKIIDFVSAGNVPYPIPLLSARSASCIITGTGWSEEPIHFGGGLFGIRCDPSMTPSRAPAVLFINMATHAHSGYGRQTTNLARTLAQKGIISLRMDVRGVGDSVDRPDGKLPMYTLDAIESVKAGVQVLTQNDARPIIAVGTCSGAYLAFHAICQDNRITAAVLVNLYCFDWELSHGGKPYDEKPIRPFSYYMALLLRWRTWRHIFGGAVPISKTVGAIMRHGLTTLFNPFLRYSSKGIDTRPISARIADLKVRGAKIAMIYSSGDLGLIDLRRQLGPLDVAAEILGDPVQIIDNADHSFAAEHAQAVLIHEIERLAACGTNYNYPLNKNNDFKNGPSKFIPISSLSG